MTDERTTDWVRIMTPDDKERIASPEYVLQLIGARGMIDNLYTRIRTLELEVDTLLAPSRKDAILTVLSDGKRHTASLIMRRCPNNGPIGRLLTELVEDGKVERYTPSRGPPLYTLKEAIP